MTLDEYLKEVKERVDKVLPGPLTICGPHTQDDAEFLAHSHTDIKKLLRIVEVQNAALRVIARCSGSPDAIVSSDVLGSIEKILEGE